jgi:predicted DCC family thiol-disulfide oxidoreductase YuxK
MADTVLYDANCNICKTITETLLTWDRGRGRLVPVPIQSDEGAALLRDVPPQLWLESFHLVREDGSVVSGGRALAPLFRQLPGGGALARAFELSPPATARTYNWIARNRVALSRFIPRRVKALSNQRLSARLSGGASSSPSGRA